MSAATATAKRDADIRRADLGADADWREAMLAAIEEVARRQPTLTTDDVLAHAPHLDGVAREPRAMGPMMLHAAREGLIVATDQYRGSHRPRSNCRHKRVWASLVYYTRERPPDMLVTMALCELVGQAMS